MPHIIYLHGLDSSPNSTKGTLTKQFAQKNNIDIDIPNLNYPPHEVVNIIKKLIKKDTVLIGSSLGGYFATLISDMTGVPAILLNPSVRPDQSFLRFIENIPKDTLKPDSIIYSTDGKWDIVYKDLDWFCNHKLKAHNGDKIIVYLKMGDELLDPNQALQFFGSKSAHIIKHDGGDHMMSDYNGYVAEIIEHVIALSCK